MTICDYRDEIDFPMRRAACSLSQWLRLHNTGRVFTIRSSDHRKDKSLTRSCRIHASTSGFVPVGRYDKSKRHVLISIDPDINGAIATFTWDQKADFHECHLPWSMLMDARIEVFDMPTEIWTMRNRNKRRPSTDGILKILRSILQDGVDARNVKAAMEFSTPTHLSGKFAWYDSGFSSGMLCGIFTSMNIEFERVPATVWKKDLGLTRQGKEGSLELARNLFKQEGIDILRCVCMSI